MIILLMYLIGFLASFPVALAAIFIFYGDVALFSQLAIGLISSSILIIFLRTIFRKERPNVYGMKKSFLHHLSRTKLRILHHYFEEIDKRSFASGHVARIIVFMTVFYLNNFPIEYVIYLGVFAVIMAFARLYVKRHVFIDIVTGAIIGAVSGYFGFYVFNQFIFQFI